ncbi:hypothetical protein EYR36_008388 [Pleurotus pulmonarius]|nr:hypothetical protein EYR36_008388 [Pleurotus pulmonarius]
MSTATRTPLPKLQLAILMVMLGAEPICNSVIFPFVNQFVRETGVTNGDERKTGYYAGIVESIFFVAECLTVLWWGRASDRIGRRPILLFGMLGLSFSMLSFGLSSKYLMIVVSRCAQGVFNGNVGVGKNSIMEITDRTNVADAFAVYPVVWATGSTLGPIIGGSLARPAVRWPDTFGKILFFQKYPYFLPCAIPGLYAIMVYIFGSIFLNETLPAKIARRRSNDTVESAGLLESDFHHTSYGTDAGSETAARGEEIEFKSPPVSSILSSRPILISLTTHAFLSFVDQSHQVLLPLMYSTSIPLGGLGFQPARIGAIMGIWGICNGIFQWLFFAKLIRKFGPRTMFRVSFSCYLVCIGAYPAMSYLTKQAGGIVDSKVRDCHYWLISESRPIFSMEAAASEVEVEVIDLTGLSSDSSDEEDEEEVTNEELSGQEDGDEDVEELDIDDATRKALHVAIATAPSPRLRQVVALLVDSSPDFELAAAKHLVTRKGRAQKAIPRYDLCANCLDEYDTRAERLDEECIFHPGEIRSRL